MTDSGTAHGVPGGRSAGVPTALWLLPCADDTHWLQALILELAERHGGPVFEPHITLHVGECPREVDPARAIGEIAALWPPLHLAARTTGESDAYYRSLYLEIADDRLDGVHLGRLRRQLVLALQEASAGIPETRSDTTLSGTTRSGTGRGVAADLDHALACYDFRPHLSLLYGNLSRPLRSELVRRNEYSGRRIKFDRIAAVRPAPGKRDLSEVADWEVSAHQGLTALPD